MKSIVVLALLSLGLGACSSSKKNAEAEAAKPAAKASAKKSSKAMKSKKKPMAKAVEGAVNCKYDSFTRVLEIIPSDTGSVVRYTKDGEASEIANCAAGSDHCNSVVTKVRENLENAGFSCS